MRTALLAVLQFVAPGPQPSTPVPGVPAPGRSAHFAYVDREFILTVEFVGPGIPLLNFVSMSDRERPLPARLVRFILDARKVPARSFLIDTGNPQEPVVVPSVRLRPRTSFGVRVKGDLGQERDASGVIVGLGDEDFKLVPLSSLEFENLALKVNRLNLGSPDFRDDWRVLKLEAVGERTPARRGLD